MSAIRGGDVGNSVTLSAIISDGIGKTINNRRLWFCQHCHLLKLVVSVTLSAIRGDGFGNTVSY